MSQQILATFDDRSLRTHAATSLPDVGSTCRALGFDPTRCDTLPYIDGDTTAGTESELQAAVAGQRERIDLAQAIEHSRYYTAMQSRARSGEVPTRMAEQLQRFLADNDSGLWENSWVRFPLRRLGAGARALLERDLLADKSNPAAGPRADRERFRLEVAGEPWVRLPISYLVRLSLADLRDRSALPAPVRQLSGRLLDHYLSDNTSPETTSFHVTPHRRGERLGPQLAVEKGRRYLLTSLLTAIANDRFGLRENGQTAHIYFAPQPPERQKQLNDLISDSFYRELFMSPCLAGWDRGEEKHQYMHLCHQVLSRSQLNAVARLKEAGIILNNLVVLPRVSNTGLANNGTHLSLGSRRLSQRLAAGDAVYGAAEEKLLGDLAIKFQEHFLPLFVGLFSGAPYRLAYGDFHPERALGFLPHQLESTHLRMLWRRWRKKASLSICGQSVTPFGPTWLDRGLSRLFGLRGGFVPDYRLIDYPVGLLSTDQSPAFNGRIGNQERLKDDLAALGVFDSRMSLYTLFKLREHRQMGFSGFEARFFSQFACLESDLADAADLQVLVTALAYKAMAAGWLRHDMIPDTPFVESERRQALFLCALDLPTFFVRQDTGNGLLLRILRHAGDVRPSRRYPGYLRVPVQSYRRALVDLLETEAPDLIERLGLGDVLDSLRRRIAFPEQFSASGRLTRGILDQLGARDPLQVEAGSFNQAAELYYHDTLHRQTLRAAFDRLAEDLGRVERLALRGDPALRKGLHRLLGDRELIQVLPRLQRELAGGSLGGADLDLLAQLTLLCLFQDERDARCPEV